MIADSAQTILFFGLIGGIANWIALRRGYFSFTPAAALPIRFQQVFGCFAIYLVLMLFVTPLLAQMLISMSSPNPPSLEMLNILQIVILLVTICFMIILSFSQGKDLFSKIIKNTSAPGSSPIIWDVALGIITWILSFPLVAVIGQICDLLLYLVYQFENYEQVAVRYLKNNIASPSQLSIALFMIVIIAPCIEEFLFRGCLQNWIKKKAGTKVAVLISSICFALFHFSSSQGLGNISLVASLFTFALFLGFLYERQKSLVASIVLHMTFNFASSIRIVFMPES